MYATEKTVFYIKLKTTNIIKASQQATKCDWL